jgi:hypothetical protein
MPAGCVKLREGISKRVDGVPDVPFLVPSSGFSGCRHRTRPNPAKSDPAQIASNGCGATVASPTPQANRSPNFDGG